MKFPFALSSNNDSWFFHILKIYVFRPSAVHVMCNYIMNFPRLIWKAIDLVLMVLLIDMVQTTCGKLNGLRDVSHPPSSPEQNLNIYENTQRLIYSSVLSAIRNAFRNDSDTAKASRTGSEMANSSRNGNRTRSGEYFLGYSNNVFGSHTNYIKEMSKDKQYYLTNDGQSRRKRSVLHLYNMVLCATGCNPLSYKGYGCYCGFLGSGFVVDGIDRCCKIHDWCYDTAGCPMFLEYFIPYLWKCYDHHHPLCALDHGEFGGPGSCAQRLCECDRQLAQCLKMYPCPSSKALCTSSPWRLLQNLLMN